MTMRSQGVSRDGGDGGRRTAGEHRADRRGHGRDRTVSLRRDPRDSQLRRVRRHRDPGLRHRPRSPVGATHPDVHRSGRRAAGERQRDRGQCADAPAVRHDAQAAGVLRPRDRPGGVEPGVSRRVRQARGRARRPPSLRAVVRGTALARAEGRDRRGGHDRRHQFGIAQHDLRTGRPARVPGGPEVADADGG